MKPKGLMQAAQTKARLIDVTGISNPTLSKIGFFVLFIITLGWMGDSILEFMKTILHIEQNFWAKTALGMIPFALVLVISWWRWRYAQQKAVKLNIKSDTIIPHSGVILFLSTVGPAHIEKLIKKDWSVLETERFPWKPCQRGLELHRRKLKEVWVVCSLQSSKHFTHFKAMFQELYPDVHFMSLQIKSFEDISALVETLEDVFANLPRDIDETDVVIDITGGQKPASVAGMMVSLVNANRQVQYVQTNEPHDVKTYAYEIKTVGKDFTQ